MGWGCSEHASGKLHQIVFVFSTGVISRIDEALLVEAHSSVRGTIRAKTATQLPPTQST